MESVEVIDKVPEVPKYDLKFAPDNYQRYFKYENRDEGENKKAFGVCRKYCVDMPRISGTTSRLQLHIKTFDPDTWNQLNRRKSRSAPSTTTHLLPSV